MYMSINKYRQFQKNSRELSNKPQSVSSVAPGGKSGVKVADLINIFSGRKENQVGFRTFSGISPQTSGDK